MDSKFLHLRKPFLQPKQSILLAEFFGIMLGDGGLSKYQAMITLNRFDDKEYIVFVSNLIIKLFNIKPKLHIYKDDPVRKSVARIQISRRGLIEYFIDHGLIIGNKVFQQATVPNWILENDKYRTACLRGLVDTDGCVYTNTYIVNNKKYSYRKIAFSNRSIPLLEFVYDTCKILGLNPYLNKGIDVRITSQKGVKDYMKIVGTHNLKHLKRFKN